MNLNEFIGILNGEYKEEAGTDAKNQCVDLANAYIHYVLGLPIIEWTNAVDFPSKASNNYDYILNTPHGVPQEGDLVIWGGTYGHIAIFLKGNDTRFTSFDENYPTGSPCHVQEHTYLSPKVLGWLHPKVTPTDIQTQLDQCRTERDRNWNWFAGLCDILQKPHDFDIAKPELEKLVGIETVANEKQKQLDQANEQIQKLTEELAKLTDQFKGLSFDNQILKNQVAQQEKTIEVSTKQIEGLQQSLHEVSEAANLPIFTGWKLLILNLLRKF